MKSRIGRIMNGILWLRNAKKSELS